MRSAWREYRVMRNWQQMVSGLLQFAQEPVFLQGVSISKRWALVGAATARARFIAPSMSSHTLFMPTMTSSFFGPFAMYDTRFALPSMLTMIPSSVMAFALVRKTSAS